MSAARKPDSNGWTLISQGETIPARRGQRFDIRLDVGDEVHGLIAGTPCDVLSIWGHLVQYPGEYPVICHVEGTHAYRVHDPDENAADAVRAERLAQFRKIADLAPVELPHEAPLDIPELAPSIALSDFADPDAFVRALMIKAAEWDARNGRAS